MAVTEDWASGNTFQASDENAVAKAINSLPWLRPCRCATTGVETFTVIAGNVTQINGTSVDGITPSVGDRILVNAAPATSGAGSPFSSQSGNGVYEVTGIAANISIVRAYEMSSSPPSPYFPGGMLTAVMAGTTNAGLVFVVITPANPNASFTYGTDAVCWAPIGYIVGTGLTLTGATLTLSSGVQANLALATTSLQSAGNALTVSGVTVQVSPMATGQILLGNAGVPTITTLSGHLSVGATGTATLTDGSVSLPKMANLAAHTVVGNSGGSPGAPSALALTTTGGANSVVSTDASANLFANVLVARAATTVTSGGMTTLTVTSPQIEQFTGSATHTCVLPDAATLSVGHPYLITNRSSGTLTVQTNGGATLKAMATNSQMVLTLISNSAGAGTWDAGYTVADLTGTVTSLSVASANGFSGTVATPSSTPAITLQTTVTGLLKGNGTGVSAALSGTDYAPATSGTALLKGSGSGGFSAASAGTDYALATSGSAALKGNGSGGFGAATLNDVGTPTTSYSMGGFALTSLGSPVNATDAATKGYTDTLLQGISAKYSALSSAGTETLTIVAGSVTQIAGTTVDGQSPAVGDYLLVMNAPAATGAAGGTTLSTQPANGLYQVSAVAANIAISRAGTMTSGNPAGAYVFVEAGPTWGTGGYVVTTPTGSGSFTYGTNNIRFTQFTGAGEIAAGTGIAKSGNTLSVSLSGGTGITVSGAAISVTSASLGPTQFSATGVKDSTTYLRGDNTWASFASAVGTTWAAGTGISIIGSTISVASASLGPTQFSATGTTNATTYLRGDNTWASLSAVILATPLSSLATPTGPIAMGTYALTGLANPTGSQDAATKIYSDSVAYHLSARLATVGTESYTVSSGTVTQIAGTTIDGVTPAAGDRLLVKDAPASTGFGSILSNTAGNGIYTVTAVTSSIALSRSADMSATSPFTPAGGAVVVQAGTANASTAWKVTSPSAQGSFTYGTTTMQWTPDINVSNVLVRAGNTISVATMSTGQAIIGNAGVPSIATLSGDISVGSAGTVTIASGAVTTIKMANISANSVLGNATGSPAAPTTLALSLTATASSIALRDASANLVANAFITSVATTATAGTTTTFTASSAPFQQFTGTASQTAVLPDSTTLTNGRPFVVTNRSTGVITVQANGGTVLKLLGADTEATFTLISNGSTAGTWDIEYVGSSITTGKVLAATNSLTLSGTDGTTMTFPTSSDTVVTQAATQPMSNKTLTAPTVNGYTEGASVLGTVTTASTLSIASATVLTATLTASTACTFTMPTATAGKSFVLFLTQAAGGGGTATFTGVKWNSAGTPSITSTAGKTDILSFLSDGTYWYGAVSQGY